MLGPDLFGWNNGQDGNTTTNTVKECSNPPYATHDWIADHALALLPQEERAVYQRMLNPTSQ